MAWLQVFRIQQWPKNLFVLAGLLFGGRWGEPGAVRAALIILLLFCLTSSLTYLWNDLRDAAGDRRHPRKAQRPIAAGRIAPAAGWTALVGGLLLLAALVLLLHPRGLPFLAAYLLLNAGYSLGLKRVPVLDLLLITAGFVIRVLAGTHAVQVPASAWILLCTGALAFFLAVAKRRLDLPDEGSGETPTFRGYQPAFLDQLLAMSAGWTVLFYGLYCSELNQRQLSAHTFLWTLPFVLFGVLHYLRRVQALKGSGRGLLLDAPLAATVAGWLATCWILLR
jgi:4-hydroxybenzoate polyprenyltransferase